MERLTDRTEKGHAYLVNVKPDEQEVDSPYKNTLQCILDCFERLAAYEDTGLTPGDIKDLQGLCKEKGLAEYVYTIIRAKRLIAKDNERSMEQDERIEQLEAELDEYRKKEADGRLVVLPYPIGTKVYIIIRHGVLHDKILENVVCGYSESEWQGSINKGKDSRFVICHNSYNMPSAYELRDVFSTHAEAEAALKAQEGAEG